MVGGPKSNKSPNITSSNINGCSDTFEMRWIFSDHFIVLLSVIVKFFENQSTTDTVITKTWRSTFLKHSVLQSLAHYHSLNFSRYFWVITAGGGAVSQARTEGNTNSCQSLDIPEILQSAADHESWLIGDAGSENWPKHFSVFFPYPFPFTPSLAPKPGQPLHFSAASKVLRNTAI